MDALARALLLPRRPADSTRPVRAEREERENHQGKVYLLLLCFYAKRSSYFFADLQYMESIGFKRHGSVQFPHKTSALMILDKNDFYKLCPF